MGRGFSLIEAMVVVALVGIVAAAALPNLLPLVQKATLEGGGENVAAFLARARSEAMTSKRCVRVYVPSTAPTTLVAERLNSFDCDVTPATLPGGLGLDGSAVVWLPVATLRLDSARLAISISQVPTSSTSAAPAPGSAVGAPAGFTGDEVRFRPSGRVFSNDVATTIPARLRNDDAIVTVTHLDIASSGLAAAKHVLIDGVGLICALQRGTMPPLDTVNGGAGNYMCPP